MASTVEPYWERFARIKREKGLTWDDLIRESRDDRVSLGTFRAFAIPPSDDENGKRSRGRYPSPETIAKVARALGVEPEEFPEYRLARAREKLDERSPFGLESALEFLAIFDEALNQRALTLGATELRGGAAPPAPPGELGRRAEGSRPKRRGQARSERPPGPGDRP